MTLARDNTALVSACAEIVRQYDPDRYLIALCAPEKARPHLWPLFAFNHEIAKTREVVSETRLGLIRLQWWRDAIGEIYEGKTPPRHEVLIPLADAIDVCALPRNLFETLIYAREFDLEDVQPASLDGLETYARNTSSPLMEMTAQIDQIFRHDGDPCAPSTPNASEAAATAYALAGLIRAVPVHARSRRCYLPADLVSEGQLYRRNPDIVAISSACAQIGRRAAMILKDTGRDSGSVERGFAALTELYLKQLRARDYNPFHPALQAPPLFRAYRVWRASRT